MPDCRVGGGFKISGTQEDPTRSDNPKVYDSINQTSNYNSRMVTNSKRSSGDINKEIRLIEKKIRQCQKKIEEDKRKKLECKLMIS